MMAGTRPGRAGFEVLVVLVVLAGILLRLLHLDADPDYYAWVGYITDEGRWVAHAREMALFGHLVNTDWLVHLLVAPLFQAGSYLMFILFGVSFWSSRLLAALSGSAILVLFWLGLRRVLAPPAVLVALALLAFEVDLVMLSRVAVPEVPAMLLQLAVYVLLVSGRPTRPRLFGAGLVLLAMVAMKATTLPMVAIFSVIVLVQPLDEPVHRWRGLLTFWAGFLTPVLPLLALFGGGWVSRSAILMNVDMLGAFIGLNTPYSIVAFPFDTEFGPVISSWALGLCLVGVAWLAHRGEPVEPSLRRLYLTAGVWYGLYAPLMVVSLYFPDRYRVHILIPMAVGLAAGLTLAPRVGSRKIARAVSGRGPAAALALASLSLPTAALWAPVLAGVSALAGVDPTHLRLKLLCLAVTLGITTWLVRRYALSRESLVRWLIAFPIAGVLLWLVGRRVGMLDVGFWPALQPAALSWWVVGPWVAALASHLLTRIGRGWERSRWLALVPAAALCYGGLVAARVAPSYLHPHYTMKQTSAKLGASLARSGGAIVSSRAEGLFNGNTLAYRSMLGRRWPARKPDVIVMAFRFSDPEQILQREYELIATYPLFVSPDYEDEHSLTLDTINHREFVKVYVRRGG
jgi:hypothetical protein